MSNPLPSLGRAGKNESSGRVGPGRAIYPAMEGDCIFCQIIRGERPAEFIYTDDTLVVFKDAYPHAPVHLLIVPRKHIRSINDVTIEDAPIISEMIYRAKEVAKEVSVAASGYKLVFNVERGAGQVVFHLHLHLIGGWAPKPT